MSCHWVKIKCLCWHVSILTNAIDSISGVSGTVGNMTLNSALCTAAYIYISSSVARLILSTVDKLARQDTSKLAFSLRVSTVVHFLVGIFMRKGWS